VVQNCSRFYKQTLPMEIQLFEAKEHNWKSNFVMCLVTQPLLALATLGDATQIEMILIKLHCPRCPRPVRQVYLWYETADSFTNKLCQWKYSFLWLRNTTGKVTL
jgi:hypothetical protein